MAGLVADRGNVYAGTIHHIHDGDTALTLLWDPLLQVYVLVAVRLRGVQAPELSDPGGPEVRAAFADLAPAGTAVAVSDVGPYPRPGHVTGALRIGGADVAGWLLEQRYAVPWNGRGAKPSVPWPPP